MTLLINGSDHSIFSGYRHAACSYEHMDLFLGHWRFRFVSFTNCLHLLEGKLSSYAIFVASYTI